MKNNVIDGKLFKSLVINGAINLRNNSKKIDDLNVFPVPDGDTGSNMSATMSSGAKEIQKLDDNEPLGSVAKTLARGLLMGARGNSGVILSQLFSGLAKGLAGLKEATCSQFAKALISGYEQAYSAVMNPVEGTILTVAKDSANYINALVKDDMSVEKLFNEYIKEIRLSLERTPDLLPILKQVGVVDSGGAGYLEIVSGMVDALNGVFYKDTNAGNPYQSTAAANFITDSDTDYGYCTEFIMQLTDFHTFEKDNFVTMISKLGNSLVVVQDDSILKVHIHTMQPGDVLNLAQMNGSFANIKIENMTLQHTEVVLHQEQNDDDCNCGHDHGKIAEPKKKYGIIAVVNGTGLKDTFIEMGCDYIIEGGQTMNPATEEFVNACEAVNAENIIIIPNNKNVFLSAQTAAKLIEDKKVSVLPAKTISQGYASLMMFDVTNSLEENLDEMSEHIKHVKTGEVTYAIRDTKTDSLDIKKDDYIAILNGDIVGNNKDRLETVKELLASIINEDDEIVTIMYGAHVDQDELEKVISFAEEEFNIEIEAIAGEQELYSYILAVE